MSTKSARDPRRPAAAGPDGTTPITDPTVEPPIAQAVDIPISFITRTSDGRQERDGIAELAGSLKASGLLNPIIVRRRGGSGSTYELAAGRRRIAAAQLLGWAQIPAFIRDLTDEQMVVVRIVENDQREDAHPLDQAANYQELRKRGYSNAAIAEMVSRPESHVYDRIRLASLIPAAQQLFRAGKIGLAHAILLSRCKASDQKRAVAPPREDRMGRETGLWRSESVSGDLFEELEKKDPLAGYHACTAVELEDWINHHVRFDRDAPDVLELFPATAANMTAAAEKGEKIIPITHEYHLDQGARAKERTYGPQSWKLADGSTGFDGRLGRNAKSKTCERSALGVIVGGDGRAGTLRVCIDKACPVHWGGEAKEARKRKKAAASGNNERAEKLERERQAREARERQRVEAERARWKKASPAIVQALAEAVAEADAKPTGYLAKVLIEHVLDWDNRRFQKTLAPGKTAESLVRWLAFMVLSADASSEYRGPEHMPAIAKALKIDLPGILQKAAPLAPGATAAAKSGSGNAGKSAKKPAPAKKKARR